MDREEALSLLKKKLKNNNLIKHCLAVEAAMRGLARYFGEDEERWGLAGLLHDLDYEETKDNPSSHGLLTSRMLEGKVDDQIIHAIKAHSGLLEAKSKMDISLYAADALTGLIVAACLVHPQKKLSFLDTDFILRRFTEKRFAQGADRGQIKSCEKVGLSLDKFVDLVLKEMQRIHCDLGL